MYYEELENRQLNIWGGVALTVVVWLFMTPAYDQCFISVTGFCDGVRLNF